VVIIYSREPIKGIVMHKSAFMVLAAFFSSGAAVAADGMFIAFRAGYSNLTADYKDFGNHSDAARSYKIVLGAGLDAMGFELEFADMSGAAINIDLTPRAWHEFFPGVSLNASDKFDVQIYSFNITQETEIGAGVSLLLGLGAGMAHIRQKMSAALRGLAEWYEFNASYSAAHSDKNLAWNLSAGLGYSFDVGFEIDAIYRYTDAGRVRYRIFADTIKKDLCMHEILVGVKYMF